MGVISPKFFMKAKKSLGQNFLIDKNVISKIVTEVSACNDDLIVEIGPGRGALTKELKKYNSNILCYELDRDLKNILQELEDDKTKIVWQDFLKSNIKDDIKDIKYNKLYIVGNLPYYITTPIIEHIMDSNINFEKLVIMVQKEVADRFLASPHTKEYGYITVVLNYYFDVSRVINVSKYAFNPVPKVESTVLRLIPKKDKINLDFNKFKDFLKKCEGNILLDESALKNIITGSSFSEENKNTLKNNLKGYDWSKIKTILDKYNMSENVRAEEISGEILIEIFKHSL